MATSRKSRFSSFILITLVLCSTFISLLPSSSVSATSRYLDTATPSEYLKTIELSRGLILCAGDRGLSSSQGGSFGVRADVTITSDDMAKNDIFDNGVVEVGYGDIGITRPDDEKRGLECS
ncbi:MAG: hypothetical protein ABI303_02740, partial [Candidatus Saccharimonas sp.]